MSCNITPIPVQGEWDGCDGNPLTDDLVEAQMKSAVDEERYEHAAKCLKELQRRAGIEQRILELLNKKTCEK